MEKSKQMENNYDDNDNSPKPSEKPLPDFPRFRRRRPPLRSNTFSTLVRILSHCHHKSQCSSPIPSSVPLQEQVATVLGDQLVVHDDLGTRDVLAHKESLANENREVISSEDQGFTSEGMKNNGLDPLNYVKVNGDIVHSVDSVVDRTQNNNIDFAVLFNNEDDEFSFPNFDLYVLGSPEHVGEKAQGLHEVSEAIESNLNANVVGGSSRPVEKENKSAPVNNEMQEKGKASEEPVSASGGIVSSFNEKTNEDIEDGEISGAPGVHEDLTNLMDEDIISYEKKSADEVQVLEDIINKEEFRQNQLQLELEKDKQTNTLCKDTIGSMVNSMEIEVRKDNRILVDHRSELVFYGDILEDNGQAGNEARLENDRNKRRLSGAKEANQPTSYPKDLVLDGRSSGGKVMANQFSVSTEKDASDDKKKRKRGPATQERKAKKKKKERMKRAEKNRKLGVKRLKLQPVSKPKTVSYCRHFLKGRCQEGDKCKFSHDTIPLTKSKPCCHFARQSCMKGNDCPFDHQLSKYPCNNILSQGSCTRGTNCMFSHEVPVKEGSPVVTGVQQLELQSVSTKDKSVSTKENLNIKKQVNPNFPNLGPKLCPSGILSSKTKEQIVAKTTSKPAGQAPKGISFLSHGKLSTGNISKQEHAALTSKEDNGVKVGDQTISGASNVLQNLNGSTKTTSIVAPRGINFLTFGKAPAEDSRSKISSSFLSVSNSDAGKSPPSDTNKVEKGDSSSKRDNGFKFDSQTGQSALTMLQNLNETLNRTPVVAPRGMNLTSGGKGHLQNSFTEKHAGFSFNKDNAVQDRQNMIDKPQTTNAFPTWLPSASLPHTSSQAPAMAPWGMNLLSVGKDQSASSVNEKQAVFNFKKDNAVQDRQNMMNKPQTPSSIPTHPPSSTVLHDKSLDQSIDVKSKNALNYSQGSFLSNTPSSVQKALRSTLAFAAKFESEAKKDLRLPAVSPELSKEAGSSQNKSTNASRILDFLYGNKNTT